MGPRELLSPWTTFRVVERLQPRALQAVGFKSTWAPTMAGPVHVLEGEGTGDLPPILLLHGLGSSGADYASFILRLRRHTRRLIIPDLPGHGLSPAPKDGMSPSRMRLAVGQALDARVGEPVIVFGNSLGGLAALRFAQLRPHRTLGVFLASPGGAPLSPEDLGDLLTTFDLSSHGAALAFVDRLLLNPGPARAVLALGLRARMRRGAIRDLIRRIAPEDLFQPGELATLPVPVHCFWGRDDRILPMRSFDFFRRELPPHGTWEDPPGYGHAPHMDQPEPFTERFLSFARRWAAPA